MANGSNERPPGGPPNTEEADRLAELLRPSWELGGAEPPPAEAAVLAPAPVAPAPNAVTPPAELPAVATPGGLSAGAQASTPEASAQASSSAQTSPGGRRTAKQTLLGLQPPPPPGLESQAPISVRPPAPAPGQSELALPPPPPPPPPPLGPPGAVAAAAAVVERDKPTMIGMGMPFPSPEEQSAEAGSLAEYPAAPASGYASDAYAEREPGSWQVAPPATAAPADVPNQSVAQIAAEFGPAQPVDTTHLAPAPPTGPAQFIEPAAQAAQGSPPADASQTDLAGTGSYPATLAGVGPAPGGAQVGFAADEPQSQSFTLAKPYVPKEGPDTPAILVDAAVLEASSAAQAEAAARRARSRRSATAQTIPGSMRALTQPISRSAVPAAIDEAEIAALKPRRGKLIATVLGLGVVAAVLGVLLLGKGEAPPSTLPRAEQAASPATAQQPEAPAVPSGAGAEAAAEAPSPAANPDTTSASHAADEDSKAADTTEQKASTAKGGADAPKPEAEGTSKATRSKAEPTAAAPKKAATPKRTTSQTASPPAKSKSVIIRDSPF